MSLRKAVLLFSVFGTLTLAIPTQAQVGRRDSGLYIRGHVRAEPNRAAENVKVDLKRETGQVLNSDFTRFNGQFEFFGLSVGYYILEVELTGFEPVRQKVEISAAPGLNGVVLMLRPTNAAGSGRPAAPISARELAIPEEARTSYSEGEKQLRETKDAGKAISHLKNAIKAYPAYYEAHQLLGVAYLEQGKQKEAEESFRKSIETSKETYGPAYSSLASLQCDLQKFDTAEPLARRAVELNEESWQGHFELARTLLGLGRAAEAEPAATQALTINKDLARAYLLRAKIYHGLQNYPAMLSDLDEFLRREPKGPTSVEIRKTRAQLAKALSDAGMDVPAEPPQF